MHAVRERLVLDFCGVDVVDANPIWNAMATSWFFGVLFGALPDFGRATLVTGSAGY